MKILNSGSDFIFAIDVFDFCRFEWFTRENDVALLHDVIFGEDAHAPVGTADIVWVATFFFDFVDGGEEIGKGNVVAPDSLLKTDDVKVAVFDKIDYCAFDAASPGVKLKNLELMFFHISTSFYTIAYQSKICYNIIKFLGGVL